MSDDKQSDVIVAEFTPTLGRQLREARESKDMTIPEVATQLRLTKDVVSQLESDQWDKMRGRIYARGYFVSYVKFLQLPYDDMMALFDDEYVVSDPALKLNHHRQPVQEKSFPWLLPISILLVSIIVWVAYQQWLTSQQALETELSQTTEETVVEETIERPVTDPVQQPEITENTVSETELMPTPEAATSAVSPATSEDTTTLDDLSLAESVSTETQPEQTATEPTEEASTETSAAGNLQIAFTANCWVEIRNGQAGVLVNKVMRAGETLAFESDEPFNISLGRANAATVTFNDETVDLTAFTRGDVAKFTLGEES